MTVKNSAGYKVIQATGGGINDGDTLATGLTFPLTGLHILDTNASHDLIISVGSNLTADRTLTITTGDANRTLTLSADATISGTNTGDTTNAALAVTLASDNLPLSGVTIASALPWLICAVVTSESGTSDSIATLDTADAAPVGSVIILRPVAGHTITLVNSSTLRCEHAEDMILTSFANTVTFVKSAAASWVMVANSKNVRSGATVTQITSRSTTVTIDADYGRIITDTSSLAAGLAAKFTVNNSRVGLNDLVDVCIKSGSTTDRTSVKVNAVAAGSFNIVVENFHASTAETGAINIHFRRHPGAVA